VATNGRDGRDGTGSYVALGTPLRGFDTSRTQIARYRDGRNGKLPDGVPPSATSRLYLRAALPAIYQEGDFGLRFIGALEALLDPIVALLDSLPGHISPEIAPRDMLRLMAAWLGIEIDEGWPEDRLRDLVRRAADLHRARGTKTGLELELALSFPHLPLRVEETGGVFHADDPAKLPKADPPGFVVYCDVPLEEAEQAAVARAIEHMKPVHVNFRLRVKAPRKTEAKT
jgi:phage tail-like protein